jgi:polysaccharide export outer membrane protein
MYIQAMTIIAIGLGTGVLLPAAESAPPPRELVQYVIAARHEGLKDATLRRNAVVVGWPEALVDEAMRFVHSQRKNGASEAETIETAQARAAQPVKVQDVTAIATGSNSIPLAPPGTSPDTTPAIQNTTKNRGVPDDYQIGAGDVLQISVWKEPEASVPSVVVRPDGRVSMPLLKEVSVMGMTPREAERAITDRLSELIHAADVTVIVTTINSKKVYIVGAAKKEGPLAYTYRMTVMQAISEAGGLTDYAKRKKIYVLHTDNGKEYRLPFNYDEVIKGEKMEQNLQLLPGDTVLIPH